MPDSRNSRNCILNTFFHFSIKYYAEERLPALMAKTIPQVACLIWTGAQKASKYKGKAGTTYGTVHLTFPENRPYSPGKIEKVMHAHRAVYILAPGM